MKDLTLLEERFVACRIAFMQVMSFRGHDQYSAKGRVVNVPVDIEKNVSILPRLSDEVEVIPVVLKKKHSFKSNVLFENIRPLAIGKALQALNDCEVYQEANVEIDMNRIPLLAGLCEGEDETQHDSPGDNTHQGDEPDDSDESDFEEHDPFPVNIASEHTVQNVVSNDNSEALVFTPGEGNRPLPLFLDPHAEAMTFLRIYGGHLRERPAHLSYQKVANSELRRLDRRCASDPVRLFYYAIALRAKKILGESVVLFEKNSRRRREE